MKYGDKIKSLLWIVWAAAILVGSLSATVGTYLQIWRPDLAPVPEQLWITGIVTALVALVGIGVKYILQMFGAFK
jgi:hypothetical protein